jgi:predicted ester cyclase
METSIITRREHMARMIGVGISAPMAMVGLALGARSQTAQATYGSYKNREPLAVAEEWIEGHRTAHHDINLLAAYASLDVGGTPSISGADQAVRSLDAFFAAIGDRQITSECAVAEGADVSVLLRVTGTHAGTLLDLAPTDKPLDFRFATFLVVQANRITRIRTLVDHLTVMTQIGAKAS